MPILSLKCLGGSNWPYWPNWPNWSYQNGELSISQRQAVIKLIEKKDKDKKLIKNWRPISLLNIDTKLISKVLPKRLKKVLPSLISKN